VASGLLVVTARNPVHSVLFLILAFFNAAGLFVLLGAEFLAMLLVVVYVGAVAVLFLFVVMMLDVDFVRSAKGFARNTCRWRLSPAILLAEMIMVLDHRGAEGGAAKAGIAPARPGADATNIEAIGARALHRLRLLLPGCGHGAADRHDRRHRPDPASAPGVAPGSPQVARERPRRRGQVKPGGQGVRSFCDGHLAQHYLAVAAILFTIGVFGIFVNRKNVIIILMSVELILLAVNINFVAFSTYLGDVSGQVLAMFVLTVAAAEAAVGLAILVTFFRNRGDIAVDDASVMKG
jgi:NADH-quinone oxidoreductase subunit K